MIDKDFGPEQLYDLINELRENSDGVFDRGDELEAVVMDKSSRKIFKSNVDKTPDGDEFYQRRGEWQFIKRGIMGKCNNLYVMTSRKIGDYYLYFYTQEPFSCGSSRDVYTDENEEVMRYDLITRCWEPVF